MKKKEIRFARALNWQWEIDLISNGEDNGCWTGSAGWQILRLLILAPETLANLPASRWRRLEVFTDIVEFLKKSDNGLIWYSCSISIVFNISVEPAVDGGTHRSAGAGSSVKWKHETVWGRPNQELGYDGTMMISLDLFRSTYWSTCSWIGSKTPTTGRILSPYPIGSFFPSLFPLESLRKPHTPRYAASDIETEAMKDQGSTAAIRHSTQHMASL